MRYTRYKGTIGEFAEDGIYKVYVDATEKQVLSVKGVDWDVWKSAERWVAERRTGKGLVTEATREELEAALNVFDPDKPRVDGIAFLPPAAA